MDHITIKLVKKNKTGTIMRDDCSNEFDYFSGKQRIKRFRKIESTKKLFAYKMKLPKVKIPKFFSSSLFITVIFIFKAFFFTLADS